MNKDPIVAEVRRARARLTKECGGDLPDMLRRDREFFDNWQGGKVTAPSHAEWKPQRPKAVAEKRVEYRAKNKK